MGLGSTIRGLGSSLNNVFYPQATRLIPAYYIAYTTNKVAQAWLESRLPSPEKRNSDTVAAISLGIRLTAFAIGFTMVTACAPNKGLTHFNKSQLLSLFVAELLTILPVTLLSAMLKTTPLAKKISEHFVTGSPVTLFSKELKAAPFLLGGLIGYLGTGSITVLTCVYALDGAFEGFFKNP